MPNNQSNEVDRIEVDSVTLGLHPSKSEVQLTYKVHDQLESERIEEPINIDASAILQTPAGYDPNDERAYPSGQKGPWVITSPEDRARDELGFTNPNLHRRLDPKLPQDDFEVIPREYRVNLMNVNSYRTTKKNYHVDYQDLETWKEENEELYNSASYTDEDGNQQNKIDDRAEDMEAREIP